MAGRFFVCLFVWVGLLALSFSWQQQDGDKGVERAAQDQNSVYDLFAILVRVNKHCDTPPEETYKDGKEEYRARELLVHLIILRLLSFIAASAFSSSLSRDMNVLAFLLRFSLRNL